MLCYFPSCNSGMSFILKLRKLFVHRIDDSCHCSELHCQLCYSLGTFLHATLGIHELGFHSGSLRFNFFPPTNISNDMLTAQLLIKSKGIIIKQYYDKCQTDFHTVCVSLTLTMNTNVPVWATVDNGIWIIWRSFQPITQRAHFTYTLFFCNKTATLYSILDYVLFKI